ncbi:MAG: hypothetical protein ACK5YR_23855 [Pirellula sp.]
MIELNIHLQYGISAESPHDPERLIGCFVESPDAHRWLHAASTLTPNTENCVYFPWSKDGKIEGVFICERTPNANRKALPDLVQETTLLFHSVKLPDELRDYQLWIPVGANLSPVPQPTEWANVLSGKPPCLVWHPGIGLLAWHKEHFRNIDSLIATPRSTLRCWEMAAPGTAFPERLLRIDVPVPPTLDQWLTDSSKGIGIANTDIEKLPPTRSEHRGRPVRNAISIVKSGMGQAVGWLADRVDGALHQGKKLIGAITPGSANSSGKMTGKKLGSTITDRPRALPGWQWIQSMRTWANRQMKQWNETLEARREASVNRLMEMLDKDPEEGLRYAIPIKNADSGRGQGTPGSELVARRFGLQDSPGGSSDPWSLSWNAQQKLRSKYTQLAQQELRAGRAERAATIYIQLLSDYPQAAQALEQGQLYRQAAEVYQERLHNISKAAEMHVYAGNFEAAVALYQKLNDHLKVGDLYSQLNMEIEASMAYRKHVEMLASSGKWCAAADVLLSKLHAVDEAIDLLQSQWPVGISASICADKTFSVLAEQELHERALLQIKRFIDDPSTKACGVWPVELVSKLAQEYPDQSVREESASAVFVLASQAIQNTAERSTLARITNSLTRAMPTDKLLGRDSRRYTQQRIEEINQQVNSKKNPGLIVYDSYRQTDSAKSILPLAQIQLEEQIHWFGMIPTPFELLCVGQRDRDLVIKIVLGEERSQPNLERVRKAFFASSEVPRWARHATWTQQGKSRSLFVIGGHGHNPEFSHSHIHEHELTLLEANANILDCYTSGLRSSSPNTLEPAVFLSAQEDRFTIGHFSADGSVHYPYQETPQGFRSFEQKAQEGIQSKHAAIDGSLAERVFAEMFRNPWRIGGTSSNLVVSCGNQIILLHEGKIVHEDELFSPICSVSMSSPWSSPRAILGMERGIAVQYLRSTDDYRTCVLDRELETPRGCFLSSGQILVAHQSGVNLYSVRGNRSTLDGTYRHKGSPLTIAAVETDELFVWTLTTSGRLQKWPSGRDRR